jgi:hypothetical protein
MSALKKAISCGDEITLLNCGRYQPYELVSKYGTKLDLPDSYTVIVLKNSQVANDLLCNNQRPLRRFQ